MQNLQPGGEAPRRLYGISQAVAKGVSAASSISHKSRMARCRGSARYRPLETDPRAVAALARSYDLRHSVRLGKFSKLFPITRDDECCQKCCRPNVISVECEGDVYHGFAVDSRGVFIHDNGHGAGVKRYAGRIGSSGKGYMVSSLGVLTLRPGHGIVYGEHGQFGEVDGRSLHALSDRVVYRVYERGDVKASAVKHATGAARPLHAQRRDLRA